MAKTTRKSSEKGKSKAAQNYDVLKEEIQNKVVRNVYLFFGEETYLIAHFIEQICSVFLDPAMAEMEEMNRIVLENETNDVQIVSVAEEYSFFACNRVVIVRNSGLFQKESFSEALQTYIKEPAEMTCLIFVEDHVRGNAKGVNFLNKHGGLAVDFQYRNQIELGKWVARLCKDGGKTASRETIDHLVAISQESMYALKNEVEKLVAYKKDAVEITKGDVDVLCTRSIKANIFEMTDALFVGNVERALVVLQQVIEAKEPPIVIIAMLSSHMYRLFMVKEQLATKKSQAAVSAALGLSPYYVKNLARQCGRVQLEKLAEAIATCHELDVKSKSTSTDIVREIELFLCSFH